MRKVFTNQELGHVFAYADGTTEGRNSNDTFYFYRDTIYSYGSHFPIAKKVRNSDGDVDHVLFTNDSYSNTTAKHINYTRRALYQRILNVYTDLDGFNPVKEVLEKEKKIMEMLGSYERARLSTSKQWHFNNIIDELSDISYILDYYRVKSKVPKRIKDYLTIPDDDLLETLSQGRVSRKNADARKEAIERNRELKRIEKAKEKEQEEIKKWKENTKQSVYLRHTQEDFLRINLNNEIETTQGIVISKEEGRRLLKLIDLQEIIGNKVQAKNGMEYPVVGMNGCLRVGCHNIPKEEIELIRTQL